jgi:hypothetical protein
MPVRRFSVDEYHRMIQAGIFGPDERFELLDGWITFKMTRNPPHDAFLDQVEEVIDSHLPPGWRVRVQSAITLPTSEPEPDLAVVPGPASRYRTAHPGPTDVALVVEVGDSSLGQDRDVKGPIYAGASLPTYWIVNLVDRRIEVYTDPSGPAAQPCYRQTRHAQLADDVDLVLGGQVVATVPVRELLG